MMDYGTEYEDRGPRPSDPTSVRIARSVAIKAASTAPSEVASTAEEIERMARRFERYILTGQFEEVPPKRETGFVVWLDRGRTREVADELEFLAGRRHGDNRFHQGSYWTCRSSDCRARQRMIEDLRKEAS